MDRFKYIKQLEERFRKLFPNSHLMINYDSSISQYLHNYTWNFAIIYREELDLNALKIFETFESDVEKDAFKQMDARLSWQMYRLNRMHQGIDEEKLELGC